MRSLRLWSCGLLAAAALAAPKIGWAQDMTRVRSTIATLASPGYHGRGYVRQGEQRTAHYLQRRFRQLNLQPLAPTYRQPFTLPINTFPGHVMLQVDGQSLRPGLDFIAAPASGGGTVRGRVLLLDTLLFSDSAVQTRLLGTSLRQTVLVLRQADVPRLTQLAPPLQAHLATAAARIVLVPDKLTASLAGQQEPVPHLEVLASRWPSAAREVRLQLDARLEPAYPTQNVVGYLPGRVQPDSFLVVTAHYDHLGRLGKRTYFPGANDNASGTAMLLELAAHYARPENRPAYSLVFLAFGAEEAGLVGSRFFVEHPLVPLSRIRFLLNLDLLGTGEEGATVVNGRVLTQAYQQLMQLNTAGHYLPALIARGRAANSDHYFFSEAGVPAFFVYTRGGSSAYHDVADTPAALSLAGFPGAFQLLRDFLNQQGAQPQ